MTTMTTQRKFDGNQIGGDLLLSSVRELERVMGPPGAKPHPPTDFDAMGEALRRLHAQVRIHGATEVIPGHSDPAVPPHPEVAEDLSRLRDEHTAILGQLDRLIRVVDTMSDRAPEDKEVFFMRARELAAIVRRHLAEEDRLFVIAEWRDTGGES